MPTDVGGYYRVSAEIRDATDALADPASITLTVTKPDRTSSSPTMEHDGLGEYHYDYQGLVEGLFKFNVATTGPITNKTEYESFIVYRSIIGLSETRNFLGIGATDTSKDELLRQVMAAVTEQVEEDYVGSCVIRDITNETVPGFSRSVIRLARGPLPTDDSVTSITSVWSGGPSWAADDLIVYPDSGTCEPKNGLGFYSGPWKATYVCGRTVIPQKVLLAVKEIIWDVWANQRPFGADDYEPGMQETAEYETTMPFRYSIPPHAEALLRGSLMPGFA